jgi:glycosyltransferase involved in cell wall biosynthesis
MKILILHGSSDLYGASKILLVTVRALIKKGHEPILLLTEDGPLVAALRETGAEILFVRLGILRRKYKSLPGIMNRLMVMHKAYHSIKKIIRKKQVTLVYSNTTAVLAGAFAAKSLGIQHVWHIHEIIETPKWLSFFLGKLVNHYSDKVIVVSAAVKKSWGKFVAIEKQELVYNGIDYSPYQQVSRKLRKELGLADNIIIIGMIGRVHPWKGQEYFIQIASLLSQKCSSIHFVMIGDAFPGNEYLYERLNGLISSENIGHLVTDLGYRSDVPELLQGFDILVLPSTLPDPFPTVVLEAMASAKPVVATAHGGTTEMVDEGITGILIPVNNPQEASTLMEKLLLDKPLQKQMGEAGRKKVLSQYSFEAFEEKIIKILE